MDSLRGDEARGVAKEFLWALAPYPEIKISYKKYFIHICSHRTY